MIFLVIRGDGHARLPALDRLAASKERVRLGPPGVDVQAFVPRDQQMRLVGLHSVIDSLNSMGRTGFDNRAAQWLDTQATQGLPEWSEILTVRQCYDPDGIDEQAQEHLATLHPVHDRIVAYVGKLIVSKGVDLLLCAWPLVLAREPDAKLMIVGFGAYREGLELLLRAIERADLAAIRQMAQCGRALEGGTPNHLAYVEAFFDGLTDVERSDYFRLARDISHSLFFTGRLNHNLLVDILPLVEVLVVPSTFPEAFGMVAVEAAACGAWPLVANHSGLAEVAGTLSKVVPAERQPLLSFELGANAVRELAEHITTWLALPPAERIRLATATRKLTVKIWSWQGVARTVLAACAGRLDELAVPVVSQ